MKNYFLLALIIGLNIQSFAQTKVFNRDLYIFKTFDDFEQKIEKKIGKFSEVFSEEYKDDEIYYLSSKRKKKKLNLSSIWGFRIEDKIYRIKKGAKIKLLNTENNLFRVYYILKKTDKIFYSLGAIELRLTFAKANQNYSSIYKQVIYKRSDRIKLFRFSENLNSPMNALEDINKTDSKFKNQSFIKCINTAKDRYDKIKMFTDLKKCINDY